MVVAMIDWTAITVASISALGAIASAAISAFVLVQIRTPSGDAIGKVVERAHDTGIATNLLVRKLNGMDQPEEAS